MKKVFMIGLTAGLSLMFLLASPAAAEDGSSYMMLKGGIYSPESDDLEDFDTDVAGEVAVGFYMTEFFALELGAGYFQTDSSSEFASSEREDDIWAIPVTLSGKFIIPLYGIKPYVLGGVGFYYVKGESEVEELGLSIDDEDTSFGYHVGAGISFNITENVLFGAEARYFWAEAEFEEDDFELKVDLDGYLAFATLQFRF